MQTLNAVAAEVKPGDKIITVDGAPVHRPDIVISTPAGWVEGSISFRHLAGTSMLTLGDSSVTVVRPETEEERQAVASNVYSWMLMLTHNPFGQHPELNTDHLALLWAMYGCEGEMGEEFEQEIQDRLDADFCYEATIPPC